LVAGGEGVNEELRRHVGELASLPLATRAPPEADRQRSRLADLEEDLCAVRQEVSAACASIERIGAADSAVQAALAALSRQQREVQEQLQQAASAEASARDELSSSIRSTQDEVQLKLRSQTEALDAVNRAVARVLEKLSECSQASSGHDIRGDLMERFSMVQSSVEQRLHSQEQVLDFLREAVSEVSSRLASCRSSDVQQQQHMRVAGERLRLSDTPPAVQEGLRGGEDDMGRRGVARPARVDEISPSLEACAWSRLVETSFHSQRSLEPTQRDLHLPTTVSQTVRSPTHLPPDQGEVSDDELHGLLSRVAESETAVAKIQQQLSDRIRKMDKLLDSVARDVWQPAAARDDTAPPADVNGFPQALS